MPRMKNACALSYVDPSFEMSGFSVYMRVTIIKAREQERVTDGGRRVFVVRQ